MTGLVGAKGEQARYCVEGSEITSAWDTHKPVPIAGLLSLEWELFAFLSGYLVLTNLQLWQCITV